LLLDHKCRHLKSSGYIIQKGLNVCRFVLDKRLYYLPSRLATNQIQYDIPYNLSICLLRDEVCIFFEHFFNGICGLKITIIFDIIHSM